MRKFQFGLRIVLKVRRQTEKRLQQEFGDLQRLLQEEIQREAALLLERGKAEAGARVEGSAMIDVELERAYYAYTQMLEKRLQDSRGKINLLQEEIIRQRRNLLDAQKAVKVLEKVKEQRYAEYCKDGRRQEQKFFDEIAGMRHQAAQDAVQ